MNNISDKTLIWVGIAGAVVAGIAAAVVFKKSDNNIE
jgi:hypothetical protein